MILFTRVWIYDHIDEETSRTIRMLSINNENSSAMFIGSRDDELVYEYTKYYDLAKHFNPDFEKALMIGGKMLDIPIQKLFC